MENTQEPGTPLPVLVLAEPRHGTENSNREALFTEEMDEIQFIERPEELGAQETCRENGKEDRLYDVSHLKNSFSFSAYNRYLEDQFIPECCGQAKITGIYANSIKMEIRFDSFYCDQCPEERVLQIHYDTPNYAKAICYLCGHCTIHHMRSKTLGFSRCKNLEHKLAHKIETLRQRVQDTMKGCCAPLDPVAIEELNARVTIRKLSSACQAGVPGYAALFLGIYGDRIRITNQGTKITAWDGQRFVERSLVWFTALIGVQLSDQLRHLKEDLNSQIVVYKRETDKKNRDSIGLEALRSRIMAIDTQMRALQSGDLAQKVCSFICKQAAMVTVHVQDQTPINWY